MKPREFWINKEDAEPYEYNPLPLKPDADKIHNFIHVREVMPDVPPYRGALLEACNIAIEVDKRLDRVTRALEKAKGFLAAVNYKVGNKTAIEILESIISGEDK